MPLMREEGRGYELARKLEACGVWRSWLGNSKYAGFSDFLNSPSSWKGFMRTYESNSRAPIHLQLRVRALLFDKASISLVFFVSSIFFYCTVVADLRLRGDDVYFTLEKPAQDWVQQREGGVLSNMASSKVRYLNFILFYLYLFACFLILKRFGPLCLVLTGMGSLGDL
ncbi:hypothetical protein I3760_04G184800 [Carya illinoinensis]|nr:hypothetical protein I3760_04G184800 [Carya illinoinensis]